MNLRKNSLERLSPIVLWSFETRLGESSDYGDVIHQISVWPALTSVVRLVR